MKIVLRNGNVVERIVSKVRIIFKFELLLSFHIVIIDTNLNFYYYFKYILQADHAGNISKQQLKIATLLGNRPMIGRCYIFWSWSLIQKWDLKKGKKCIR